MDVKRDNFKNGEGGGDLREKGEPGDLSEQGEGGDLKEKVWGGALEKDEGEALRGKSKVCFEEGMGGIFKREEREGR